MPVSKEDVIAAYRAIHGREPENEAVIESQAGQESLEALLKEFLASDEFVSRMRYHYEKYGLSENRERSYFRGELGALEEAARRYRNAIERNPKDSAAWVSYGNALKEQEQLKLAEVAFRRALELDDRLVDAHIHLGDLLRRSDRHDEAESAYITAYRLDAKSHVAAARLRSLSPEVASRAFGTALFEDHELADWFAARRRYLHAAGLPSRAPSPLDPASKIATFATAAASPQGGSRASPDSDP